jgi:hypothetical protein
MSEPREGSRPLDVLVLYSGYETGTDTTREHLHALALHSRHRVYYAPAAIDARLDFDLADFDVVVIHHSVRVAYPGRGLTPTFFQAVEAFCGPKFIFLQDEYDFSHIAGELFNRLGINVVFNCVPPEHLSAYYPNVAGHVEFVQVLTGYVPDRIDARHASTLPGPAERPIVIGYRGRALPFRYGDLAREKLTIAQRMKAICIERNIPHDIEWDDSKRVYGNAWNTFLASCRATLGSETGANVIDPDGSLTAAIDRALAADCSLTYEQVHARFLRGIDGAVTVNQVSPRIFEAIAQRTGLVLFEGTYSNVVKPGRHFIPLKKDFSNIDEVLRQINDDELLVGMTERAYRDVILSGRYSYAHMVAQVDAAIARLATRCRPRSSLPEHVVFGRLAPAGKGYRVSALYSAPLSSYAINPSPPPLAVRLLKACWRRWPQRLKPAVRHVVAAAQVCSSLQRWAQLLGVVTQYLLHRRTRRLVQACLQNGTLRRAIGVAVLGEDLIRIEGAARRLRSSQNASVPPLALRLRPELATFELCGTSGDVGATIGDDKSWNEFAREVTETRSLILVLEDAALQPARYTFEGLMTIARHEPVAALAYLRSLFAGCSVCIGASVHQNGAAKDSASRPAA